MGAHAANQTPATATLRLTSTAAAVLAMICATASAQDAAKPPADAASAPATQVVVTANRRNEAARNVPMAIDVVGGKELDRLQLLDAKDIQKVAPGLEMTNNDGRQNVAAMRGVAYNPDTGVSVASVGVYVNEVAVSANVAFNAMFDIGQIEVLRGPQGTLRGQMTPAGAITMTSRRPDLARLGGELSFSADDQKNRNVRAAFNLPIVNDTLAVRFAAVKDRNAANYVHNLSTGKDSRSDTDGYRLSVAWQATEGLRFDLMSQQLDVDTSQTKQLLGTGVVTPFNLGRPETPISLDQRAGVTEQPDDYRTRAKLTTLKSTWSFDDHHSLSFVAGYQDIKLNQGFDRDVGNVLPQTSIWQQVDTRVRVDSAELVLNSEGNPFWNYTVGLYREHAQAHSAVDVASGAFLLDIPGTTTSRAIFTRQSFKLGNSLSLDAGLRYSILSTQRQSVASVPGFTFPPSIPPAFAEVTDRPLTWGLSLTNRFSRELTAYAAFGRSFRPGTYQVGVLNPIDTGLLGKGPEKSDALEFGFKSDIWDRKASLNVALFGQRYKGYIDYVPDVTYQYVNPFTGQTARDNSPFTSSGNAQVQGVEMQLFGRPSPNWDFNVGTSWVHSHYTGGSAPCNDSNGDGVPDNAGSSQIPSGQQVAFCPLKGRISELPRFSLSTGSEYRFEWGAVRPYIGLLVNHRPGFHSDKINYDYATFTNLSLFGGVRSAKGDWEVGLFVKNALDQQRVTNTTTTNNQVAVPQLGLIDSGYRTVVTTPPRQVGVTGRFSF